MPTASSPLCSGRARPARTAAHLLVTETLCADSAEREADDVTDGLLRVARNRAHGLLSESVVDRVAHIAAWREDVGVSGKGWRCRIRLLLLQAQF